MNAAIDISATQSKELLDLLRRYLPGVVVWAFGSRVKWTARLNSDLDLVAFSAPQQQGQVSALKEAFEESDLPFRIDLLVWDELPESFHQNILQQYVVLVAGEDKNSNEALDWKLTTLGNVLELKRGYDLPQPKRRLGDFPVVSSAGIRDFHNEFMVPGPGVVTGRYGTIGQVFFIDGDFWPLNTTLYVCDFKGNDPKFISYLLRTIDFLAYSDKGAVPGVNRNHLHMAQVKLPPFKQQRIIAHILGTLDDKIELNRRINQTLEQMAQAIFKSWFVDFDPVRAKMAGRQPEGMSAATAALFPDELVASELGLIPKGWEACPMPELIDINPSRQLKKGTSAPYLDMANVPTNSARVESVILREFGSGSKFMNGDTLLARITPCLENGKTAYVDFLEFEQVGWGSTEFIVLRPKPPLPAEFAYFLCRHPHFRSFAIAQMAGTSGRQRVPNDCFSNYAMVAPSKEVAAAFGIFAKAILAQVKAVDEVSRTLAVLRDTLLPKLLSGELSLSAVEKQAVA